MDAQQVGLVPTGPAELPALRRLFDHPSFQRWGATSPLSDGELAAKYAGARLPEVECFIVEVDSSPAGLAILERARQVHGWRRLTVDPDLSNEAGIRFWRAVGFTAVREEPATEHRAAFVLMEMVLASSVGG